MAKDSFNWCFIGTGVMAQNAAREMSIVRLRSHKIVSAYSLDKSSTDSFVLWFGGKSCDSLEEAICTEGVDAVYVATTNDSHYEIAKKCIELGKPVLLEKPFTINATQAEALFKLAEEKNVYITEGMWTWYHAVAKKVREWIITGEIGDVKRADLKYAMASSIFIRTPSLFDKNTGGGSLLRKGEYAIAYCYNIFGKPSTVECVGELNENGVDTGERITLKYDNGLVCNLRVSLTAFEGPEIAVFTGSGGTITVPLFHQAVKANLMSNSKRDSVRNVTSIMTEFDAVADEIVSGKTSCSHISKENIIGTLKIMDECREQMGLKYPCEDIEL